MVLYHMEGYLDSIINAAVFLFNCIYTFLPITEYV